MDTRSVHVLLHHYQGLTMRPTGGYGPADHLSLCCTVYFSDKPKDMFLSLLDKKFVEMIPDMLEFPHIHIDSCVLVIYYGVLWYGCTKSMEYEPSERARKWSKLTYLACLRALPGWQREATGTVTDILAATTMVWAPSHTFSLPSFFTSLYRQFLSTDMIPLLLVQARVCMECFDYEMTWKMIKLAGEYAKGLGVHNLDGEDGGMMAGLHRPGLRDDDRRSWWDLVQVDCLFRLIFDKPPSITQEAWKVNLPWLGPSAETPQEGDTAMMLFIVTSRLTLILIQFFAMLEEEEDEGGQGESSPAGKMCRAEEMCRQIESLYEEWNLVRAPSEVGQFKDFSFDTAPSPYTTVSNHPAPYSNPALVSDTNILSQKESMLTQKKRVNG